MYTMQQQKKKKQNRIQLVKVTVYFFISLWHGFLDLCVFEARENVFTEVFLVFYDKRLSIESTGTIAYR